MSPRKKTGASADPEPEPVEPEPSEPAASEPEPEPEPVEPEPSEPVVEEPVPEPPAASGTATAPDLSKQIEDALRKIHDDEKHQAEHERLTAVGAEPEKPKTFFNRLKWGG